MHSSIGGNQLVDLPLLQKAGFADNCFYAGILCQALFLSKFYILTFAYPPNAVIGNCLSWMLSAQERATKKLVGAQAAFPRPIFSIFNSRIPTATDYAKDRLFPLKDKWETVDKILMVDTDLAGRFF